MVFQTGLIMKPFNTVEDISIRAKTPEEALAILPVWLVTMLTTLWEKQ